MFTEDNNTDVAMSDSYNTDVKIQNEINRPGNIRNGPWLAVEEPNYFVIDRMSPFSSDHDPVGFDPNLT